MKRSILLMVIVLSVFMFLSCKSEMKQGATADKNADTTSIAAEIIKSSVTDKDGITLEMSFDNTKQIATFLLNGETIEMKQEVMASGIKYSNENYVFTEHQGEIQLQKNGVTVFYYKK